MELSNFHYQNAGAFLSSYFQIKTCKTQEIFLHDNIFGILELQKEESIQFVVGKTFDSMVLSSDKNVLLEVCIYIPSLHSLQVHFCFLWYAVLSAHVKLFVFLLCFNLLERSIMQNSDFLLFEDMCVIRSGSLGCMLNVNHYIKKYIIGRIMLYYIVIFVILS